jgi:hypothetical protein
MNCAQAERVSRYTKETVWPSHAEGFVSLSKTTAAVQCVREHRFRTTSLISRGKHASFA